MLGSYKVEPNTAYGSTISQTKQKNWVFTSYYMLRAADFKDAMDGTTFIIEATVSSMLVGTLGKCSAYVGMALIDQTANDVIAQGTLTLMTKSEDNVFEVTNAQVTPRDGVMLNNVKPSSTSTGVKKEESTVRIASGPVTYIEIDTKEGVLLSGEVISRGLTSETAQKILTTAVGAVKTVTLNKPTEQTYIGRPFPLPVSYSYQRSSEGTKANYTGFVDELGDSVRIMDSSYQFCACGGAVAGSREYNLALGGQHLIGSSSLPNVPFGSQERYEIQSLLRDQRGEFRGIVYTQLESQQVAPQLFIDVSESFVTADSAATTAANLSDSVRIDRLTKLNN